MWIELKFRRGARRIYIMTETVMSFIFIPATLPNWKCIASFLYSKRHTFRKRCRLVNETCLGTIPPGLSHTMLLYFCVCWNIFFTQFRNALHPMDGVFSWRRLHFTTLQYEFIYHLHKRDAMSNERDFVNEVVIKVEINEYAELSTTDFPLNLPIYTRNRHLRRIRTTIKYKVTVKI